MNYNKRAAKPFTYLAKNNDVWLASIVINSQPMAGASQTSLDLISN